ncbi:MAG: hypothetical protein BWX80_03822 [Candidatus Hydrogenedentes bacterium ADurb.Bin101]|nr:MAG: hypothetical protein BWX80_03822 [Candidatus Hydrogenedentes bacterium ADurb.Bin101]
MGWFFAFTVARRECRRVRIYPPGRFVTQEVDQSAAMVVVPMTQDHCIYVRQANAERISVFTKGCSLAGVKEKGACGRFHPQGKAVFRVEPRAAGDVVHHHGYFNCSSHCVCSGALTGRDMISDRTRSTRFPGRR